jgi:predicted DNA-binding antitoxin AbrB/MazE fold protein
VLPAPRPRLRKIDGSCYNRFVELEHETMSHTVRAIYENGLLKLEEPLPFKDKEKVRVTVEAIDSGSHSVLDIQPVSLGSLLAPLTVDDDLLDEMLQGRIA